MLVFVETNRKLRAAFIFSHFEVMNFVVFLCSQKSSFATGALFVIDGGQTRS